MVAAVLWSSGGALIKLIDWDPFAIAGMRSGVAAIAVAIAVGRPRSSWSASLLLGAVFYAATVTLFVIATKWTTAANAIMLQYTSPVFAAFFGMWFLQEEVTIRDWIMIILVLGGVVLMFIQSITFITTLGNLCALGGGVAFAALIITLRKQQRPIESVLLGNIVVALALSPSFRLIRPNASAIVALLCLGIFQLGLSYVLYSRAIPLVRAVDAALIPMIEPILNPVWVFLLVGERPGRVSVIGGLIVLTAIAARGVQCADSHDLAEQLT